MIGLLQSLETHELVVLRTLGEWWDLPLVGMDRAQCAAALADRLVQLNMQAYLIELQPQEAEALSALVAAGGQIAVPIFERMYGSVRPMGPAALEREEPWLAPHSVAEALWYLGFIFKGFAETDNGLIEFFYIPPELLALFEHDEHDDDGNEIQINERATDETTYEQTVQIEEDQIVYQAVHEPGSFAAGQQDAVDKLTTLLALSQMGRDIDAEIESDVNAHFLWTIATDMGLAKHGKPTRSAVAWLKLSRTEALAQLIEGWLQTTWDNLYHVPGLICEPGQWTYDPAASRHVLLDYLPRESRWITVSELVALVEQTAPDFQRPDGNYDTWYIRDAESDTYLAGFESWLAVEGRLLHYVLTRPMHWLGLVDVGISENSDDEVVRPTPALLARLTHQQPNGTAIDTPNTPKEMSLPIIIQPSATIVVPIEANRLHRFQLSRIAILDTPEDGKPWLFHITPQSLKHAQTQGIQTARVVQFLEEIGEGRPLPASTKRAIERWSLHGTEGQLIETTILRVSDKTIVEKLRQNSKTRPFIGESLGDLSVVIQGDPEQFRNMTAQLGLLLDSHLM